MPHKSDGFFHGLDVNDPDLFFGAKVFFGAEYPVTWEVFVPQLSIPVNLGVPALKLVRVVFYQPVYLLAHDSLVDPGNPRWVASS